MYDNFTKVTQHQPGANKPFEVMTMLLLLLPCTDAVRCAKCMFANQSRLYKQRRSSAALELTKTADQINVLFASALDVDEQATLFSKSSDDP